jgi:hypothetical protein
MTKATLKRMPVIDRRVIWRTRAVDGDWIGPEHLHVARLPGRFPPDASDHETAFSVKADVKAAHTWVLLR